MKTRKSHRILNLLMKIIFLVLTFIDPVRSQSSVDQKSIMDQIDTSEALKLVYSPEPQFTPFQPKEIDPSYLAEMGFDQTYPNVSVKFKMRDGKNLFTYHYPKPGAKVSIVVLHGVLSSAYLMNRTSGLLQQATGAEVYAVDLRGHGQSEGKPGDVDYIDQYASDLADLITEIKLKKPHHKVILAGHSMGGGIALRYAQMDKVPAVDGYLLYAPLLGQDSPTIPKGSENANENQEESFLKIHILRLIGLKMLNLTGNHSLDSLPVLFFNLPPASPVKSYSHRANESMAPAEYKSGLASVKKPLLVIVGSRDEAFVATEYEAAVGNNSAGEFDMIEGATHNGIRHHAESLRSIRSWFEKHQFNN